MTTTPDKPTGPAGISYREAAAILGVSYATIFRLVKEGTLARIDERKHGLSRRQVHEYGANPWITGTQAAEILGISTTRVYQLACKDLLPHGYTPSGRRRYRKNQIEVISRARQIRFHTDKPLITANAVGGPQDEATPNSEKLR